MSADVDIDVDAVQLLQTRIVQKGYDATSDGQNACLLTVVEGYQYRQWGRHDCCAIRIPGVPTNRTNIVPTYCKFGSSQIGKEGIASICCKDQCDRGCYLEGTPNWGDGGRHTTEPIPTTTTTTTNLSDHQQACISRESVGGWANYDCCGFGTRIKVVPVYCKSGLADFDHAIGEVCCKSQCDDGCIVDGKENYGVTTTTSTTTVTTSTTKVACSTNQPKCLGVTCTDGQWVCGGEPTVCPGTDSPGGDTDVTDADCFDAERGFGPDFSCANTDMWCSSDSGEGLTVGACCPTQCKTEFENKRKNSNAEKRSKNEQERKAKRADNEGKRKANEKERKKKRKDTEWNTKRDAKENKNKNEETERKNKRGWKEGQRKNEQSWKKKRRERRAAANKRESARKETRNKNNKKPTSKACAKKKAKYAKCKAKPKCEKKNKKKGWKEPTC